VTSGARRDDGAEIEHVPPDAGSDASRADLGSDAGFDASRADLGECPDVDGDGRGAMPCGDDCDDNDPTRYPGADELCDYAGHDEDCNDSTYGTKDDDSDGYVDARCCNGTTCGEDCDDTRGGTHPGLPEVCNRRDDDCNGVVDEDSQVPGYSDLDRDLYGDLDSPTMACAGSGLSVNSTDCDDDSGTAGRASPAFGEVAGDGIDNNCNGMIDEGGGPAALWYRDADGDGFGVGTAMSASVVLIGYALLAADCDDSDGTLSPVAAELCNGRDDDCNGQADFAIGINDSEDDDGDGFVDAACGAPANDCDDGDRSTFARAPELCDGRDNDCDAMIDEACAEPMDGGVPSDLGVDLGPSDLGVDLGAPIDAGAGPSAFTARTVAGYASTFCAARAGFAICWGGNLYGQLGSTAGSTLPVVVPGVSGVVSVAVANAAACALTSAGEVYCWGSDTNEALGNASPGASSAPQLAARVTGISDARDVVGNWYNFCVRHATGRVSCWGDGAYGVLDGAVRSEAPVDIGLSGIVEIEAASWNRVVFCGRSDVGSVSCWGGASNLTTCGGGDCGTAPFDVGLSGVTQLDSVGNAICARLASAWSCWGDDAPLISGTRISRALAVPTVLTDYSTFLQLGGVATGRSGAACGSSVGTSLCGGPPIAPDLAVSFRSDWFTQLTSFGWTAMCGVTPTGGVKCVGSGSSYELGTGTSGASSTFVDVVFPP